MKTKEIKIGNLVIASVAARLIAVAVLCVIALSGCQKENFEPEWTNYDTVYYEYTKTPGGSYCWTSDQDLTPRAAFIKVTAEEAGMIFDDCLKLTNKMRRLPTDSIIMHKSTVYANKDGYMYKKDNGWFIQMRYVEELIKTDANFVPIAEEAYKMLPDWIGADGSVSKGVKLETFMQELEHIICECQINLNNICARHGKQIYADVLYWLTDGSDITFIGNGERYTDAIAIDVDSVYLIEYKK